MKSMNQSGKIKWAIGIWMAILFVGLGAYMTVNGAPSGTVAVVNTYGQETPGAGGQGVVTPVIVAFAAPNANTLTFTPTFTMTSTQTYTPTQTYTNTPTGSNTPAAGTNTLTLTNTLTPTFTYTPTFTLTSTSTYTPSLTPVNTPIPPTPIINVADYQVAVAGGSTAVTIIPPFDFTSLVVNFTSGTGVTVVPAFISGAVTTVGTSPLLFADVMGNVNISPIATTGNSYVTRIIGMQGVVLQPNGAVSLVAKFTYAHSGLGEANNINNIAKNYYPTLTPTFTGTLTPTITPTPPVVTDNGQMYIEYVSGKWGQNSVVVPTPPNGFIPKSICLTSASQIPVGQQISTLFNSSLMNVNSSSGGGTPVTVVGLVTSVSECKGFYIVGNGVGSGNLPNYFINFGQPTATVTAVATTTATPVVTVEVDWSR